MTVQHLPQMSTIGLLGKLPQEADFVREGGAGPALLALDRFLVSSIEALNGARASHCASAVRFAVAVPEAGAHVVGVLVPSHDQVGREFPLAVCTVVTPLRSFPLATLPLAAGEFFDGAEEVAIALASGSHGREERQDLLQGIAPIAGAAFAQAEAAVQQALERDSVADFLGRTFGEQGNVHAQARYGFYTLLSAAQAAQAEASQRGGTVLDCPIAIDVDLIAWLALVEQLVGSCPLDCFWIEAAEPRLLLTVNGPSPQVIRYLADPAVSGPRLWPLRTTSAPALDYALHAAALPDGWPNPDSDGPLVELLGQVEQLAQRFTP